MPDAFFIDTSGAVVPVAPADIAGASQLGWIPASPKQVSDWQLSQKFGTAGEAFKAFGEHAASAATLGLSDVLERAAGVDPEAMRAREQANPLASGLGTAAGVAGGLLAPGSAPSLIAKAGKAVAGATAKALPAGLLAKALASGAGSAIEGAAYGLGQVVHEKALGNPDLTAQSALATVGLSAALGGALGGAGGVLGHALGEGAKALPDWLAKLEGERNIKAAGAIQSDINRALKTRSRESLVKIGREFGDYGLVGPLSSPESTLAKATELIQQGAGKAKELTEAADAAPGAQKWSWPEIRAEVEPDLAAGLRTKGSTFAVADDLKNTLDRYDQAYAGRDLGLTDLHALRQDVDELIYKHGRSLDPFAKDVAKPLKKVRDFIADELTEGVEDAGLPVDAWKGAMREQEVGLTAKRFAEAGMKRAHGNNPIGLSALIAGAGAGAHAGPVGALVTGLGTEFLKRHASGMLGTAARVLREAIDSGAVEGVVNRSADAIAAARAAGTDTLTAEASSAPEKVATLSLLERLNQTANRKVENGIAAVVRGAPRAGAAGRAEAIAEGISQAFGSGPEDARKRFAKQTQEIRKLAGDPEQLQQKLAAQTDDWHEHAPNTAQALQIATARAVAFLSSKLPMEGKAGPLAQEPTPSRAELSRFTRYYEAVQHPMGLLKQAAAGTLTPEAVEAVQTVYPALYERMRGEAVNRMATAKAVPYRAKLMLSMLMGQDMDGTTAPMALMRNRAVFAQPAMMPPPMKSPKLTLANRMQTPMQESAARRGGR